MSPYLLAFLPHLIIFGLVAWVMVLLIKQNREKAALIKARKDKVVDLNKLRKK